jgi:hypothetical protein
VGKGREQVAQHLGMTPASPHSAQTVPGKIAQGRHGCTVRGRGGSPGGVRESAWGDSPADHGALDVTGHLMPRSGGVHEMP